MSCMHFDAVTYAQIVKVLTDGSCGDAGDEALRVGGNLAKIAKANTRAFNYRYPGENAKAPSLKEIFAAWVKLENSGEVVSVRNVCKTVALIPYNCEEGVDQLGKVKGARAAMQETLTEALFAQCHESERLEEQVLKAPPFHAPGFGTWHGS